MTNALTIILSRVIAVVSVLAITIEITMGNEELLKSEVLHPTHKVHFY